PQAEAQRPEVADRAQDDGRPGSRGAAGDPWMVGHADLSDRATALAELDEELGREERAAGLHTDPLERRSAEELARAVDVADAQAEEQPVRQAVCPRVQRAERRGRAPDPVADHDVRRIRRSGSLAEAAQGRGPGPAAAGRA